MGAPTEIWKTYKVTCAECPKERFVELHHDWEPLDDADKVYPPYGVRLKKHGWEFRIVDDGESVYVDVRCPKCVAKESEGKVTVKA